MKLSGQVFVAMMALTVVVQGDVLYDASELTTCEGVTWSRCEQGALDWFVDTLQKTYNDIHMPAKYLYDTKWVGVQGTADGDEHGRRLQGGSGASSGGTGCSWCTDDDAFVTETDSLEDHEEWAAKVTLALQNSGFSCLSGAQNCVINMDTTRKGMMTATSSPWAPAAARVQCSHVDWESLTLSEKQFAASSLERAFADAQTGGKSQLQGVRWEESATEQASWLEFLVSSSASGRAGLFRGELQSEDASSLTSDGGNLRSSNGDDDFASLWEARFLDLLGNGPYSSLARSDDCKIHLQVLSLQAANAGDH